MIMGFSSEEFIRMRDMESYQFDYCVPLTCERWYSFGIEAESEEEAIKEAEDYIKRGLIDERDIVNETDSHESKTGSTLYLGDKVVKSY